MDEACAAEGSPAIEAREVSKVYQQAGRGGGGASVHALRLVSLRIMPRERVAIVGRSGSGKSTLLNLLGTLDQPSTGSVFLNGIDISTLSERARTRVRRHELGFVFQSFNLMATLSVLENVMLPAMLAGRGRDARQLAASRLAQVGLSHRAEHHPYQLSGGEMQRTAIARALVLDPPVVLADEPTGNLDSETSEAILELLVGTVASGRTVVLITHDRSVAARQERIITLKDGAIESDEACSRVSATSRHRHEAVS